MNNSTFSTLGLDSALLANLESMGYQTMTPVQEKSVAALIAGNDLIVQAETGSGKTAAFGIGILARLDVRVFKVQTLILCPTRELADQVSKEIRRLASHIPNVKVLTLCGGSPTGPQLGSLERGAHIVVGTPGRILKHQRKGSLKLDAVKSLVLDEADRMLDMGFYDDIAEIVSATPASRQTVLFSATYPDTIERISASMQKNPSRIVVEATHTQNNIEQVLFEVSAKGERVATLVEVLRHYAPASSVIFCNTKQQCQEIAHLLRAEGFSALALHGDLEQRDRDQTLVQFSNRSCSILVATDVAARGLDIKDLAAVINFEVSHDPEVHVHRIGRTGRAGNTGLAISLFTASEVHRVNAIEAYQNSAFTLSDRKILRADSKRILAPAMVTICIDGGRKGKLRAGDILGALTNESGITGDHVGKIDIFDYHAYVAVNRSIVDRALSQLTSRQIKGKSFKVRKLE